jgi:predicted NodU family carbamoyl transferase
MTESEQLAELIKKIVNRSKSKVIGLRDLHTKAADAGITYDYSEDLFDDVCRLLRDENIVAYVQGRGIFMHLRIVD